MVFNEGVDLLVAETALYVGNQVIHLIMSKLRKRIVIMFCNIFPSQFLFITFFLAFGEDWEPRFDKVTNQTHDPDFPV